MMDDPHVINEYRKNELLKSAILESSMDAIITVTSDGIIVGWNPAATRMFGYPAETALGGDMVSLIVPPHLRDAHLAGMKRYVETGKAKLIGSDVETVAMRSDGSTFPVELIVKEINLSDGQLFVSYIKDITDRHKLRESEEKFRLLVEGVEDYAIYMLDCNGTIISWNVGAEKLLGWKANEAIGKHISIFHVNVDCSDINRELNTAIEKGVFQEESLRCRKDGTTFDADVTLTSLHDDTGNLKGFSKIVKDITQRKTAERHQRILIAELNHRVKNTLAIVQSIATQTLRGYDADPMFKLHFEGRLRALANAHDILSNENWEGANIRAVIYDTLRYQQGYETSGPYLRINPKVAISLSMFLHELATNAAKYGSLSVEGGVVKIMWSTERNRFRFLWKEVGGPPVKMPTKKGFGSRLLRYGLGFDYDGRTKIAYRPSGVAFTVNVPLSNVLEERN